MSTAPRLKKVRIQDVQPGMKTARIDVNLDFVYLPIDKILPMKVTEHGRQVTKSYKVYLVGWNPGTQQDRCMAPFIVRPSARIDIVQED